MIQYLDQKPKSKYEYADDTLYYSVYLVSINLWLIGCSRFYWPNNTNLLFF